MGGRVIAFVLLSALCAVGQTSGVAAQEPPPEGTGVPISGFLFDDRNGNGIRDPQEQLECSLDPIGGGIMLFADADDVGDVGLVLQHAAVSAPDGAYTFSDVAPGTYFVLGLPECLNRGVLRFVQIFTTPQVVQVEVGSEPVVGPDFGSFRLPIVRGTTFLDGNRDGVRSAEEADVSLDLTGCSVSATRLEDGTVSQNVGSGSQFRFDLLPGTHRISGACAGYERTTPEATVVAVSGEIVTLDVGFAPPPAVTTTSRPTTTRVLAVTGAPRSTGGASVLAVLLLAAGALATTRGRALRAAGYTRKSSRIARPMMKREPRP